MYNELASPSTTIDRGNFSNQTFIELFNFQLSIGMLRWRFFSRIDIGIAIDIELEL